MILRLDLISVIIQRNVHCLKDLRLVLLAATQSRRKDPLCLLLCQDTGAVVRRLLLRQPHMSKLQFGIHRKDIVICLDPHAEAV